MDIAEFTEKQKQALIDLLVFGMYSDGHVAAAEEARIQKVLALIETGSEYDRQKILDASVTRVRAISSSSQSVQGFAAEVAKEFPKPELRRQVREVLEFLLDSDDRITDRERELLKTINEAFQVLILWAGGRMLSLGNVGQQLDIGDLSDAIGQMQGAVRQNEQVDHLQEQSIAKLTSENRELKLYVATLMRLLVSKGVIKPEEVEATVKAIENE